MSKWILIACLSALPLLNAFGQKDLSYTVSPNPLELHSDSIFITLDIEVPSKVIGKKGVVIVEPVLHYDGKVMSFPSTRLQGAKVKGKGNSIEPSGGSYQLKTAILFRPGMEKASLSVKETWFEAAKPEKKMVKESHELCNGTTTISMLLQQDDKVMAARIGYNKDENIATAPVVEDPHLFNDPLANYGHLMEHYIQQEEATPEDWRVINNLGCLYYLQGNLEGAEEQFYKAFKISENVLTSNNVGVMKRIGGDYLKAQALFEKSNTSSEATRYNMGMVAFYLGNYKTAGDLMGATPSYNQALANLLYGDAARASILLRSKGGQLDAKDHYLLSIIACAQDDVEKLCSELEMAFQMDALLKKQARAEAYFLKFSENAAFKALMEE